MSKDEKTTFACRHGSLWCGCRHNLAQFAKHDASAASTPLMGRPKYPPRRTRAKVNKKAAAKMGLAAMGR